MTEQQTLTDEYRQAIRNLIEREVVPAVGCTEPVAVALAAARARQLLATVTDSPVETVRCRLSANIIKNAMGVGIPGTGMIGLPIAVALGATIGDASRRLEVLADVTPAGVEAARKSLVDTGAIEIELADDATDMLHIDVSVEGGGHTARAIICGAHDRFVLSEIDGRPVSAEQGDGPDGKADSAADTPHLTMALVWDYAMNTPVDRLSDILEAARLNSTASEYAIRGGYGHEIGATLRGGGYRHIFGNTPFARILARTASACDARMGGAPVPVMSNSGSGNQGIAATMPVVSYADEIGADRDTLIRALTLSHLTAIYIKQSLGRLSALCGCIVASSGSAAGICYLMGGDYNRVCASIKNMVANLTGMICDGAKPSCALKLTSAVSTAILSAIMAMEDRSVTSIEGIIDDDVDRTIRNLTDLGRDAMTQTDAMILSIMTRK